MLALRGWSDLAPWDAAYADLPSRQAKVKVADREVMSCSDDEMTALAPAAVQPRLDAAMAAASTPAAAARAFVRPSGTEDVVRVYAEAATQDAADALAQQAVDIVFEDAGGVGEKIKVVP